MDNITEEMLMSQLKGLSHPRTRAGAVGTLLLMLPALQQEHAPLLAPYVEQLTKLCAEGSGPDAPEDPSVQANAAAVLAAAASMSDELHAAVDEAAADTLGELLCRCAEASTSGGGGEGSGDGGGKAAGSNSNGALTINVLGAVAQLAREQGRMLEVARSPEALAALVACCAPDLNHAVVEAALDALCALASHEDARAALRAAGAVPAAAAAVAASTDADALVRALMLLGMLVSASAEGRGELVAAAEGRGVVRLFGLARQYEDEDCKVIARDLLGLLTRDPETRAGVEAAVRRAAEAVTAAVAGGAPSGAAA